MEDEDYQIYAMDLERYPLDVIELATKNLATTPRREGETAFPEVAAIAGECKRIIVDRRGNESLEKIKAQEQHRKDYPEEYVDIREDINSLLKSKGMDEPPVVEAPQEMLDCPHCGISLPIQKNLRFWSVEEIRSYADTLEKIRISAEEIRQAKIAERAEVIGVA